MRRRSALSLPVGFECIPQVDDRHTFYHTAELFSTISPDWDVYLDSSLDEQGFGYAREGVHAFPFALHLLLDGMCGNPKGTLNINSGVSVRYIAMVYVSPSSQNCTPQLFLVR